MDSQDKAFTPSGSTAEELHPDTNPAMYPKILIVDDEKAITDTLSRFFEFEGYHVMTVNDPYSALKVINRENIFIVISDISMPGMSGVDLLQRIKQHNGMIQVIMITGFVTLDNILACLRRGADECFLKPFSDLSQLKRAVDDAMAKLKRWQDLMLEISRNR